VEVRALRSTGFRLSRSLDRSAGMTTERDANGTAKVSLVSRCQTARPDRSRRAASSFIAHSQLIPSNSISRSRCASARGLISTMSVVPRPRERSAERRQSSIADATPRSPRKQSAARILPSTCEIDARGALASRRSTVAIFDPVPGFASRHFLRGHVQQRSSSQPSRVTKVTKARRAGARPPESTVASRRPGRHSRLRLPDASRMRPSKSRDAVHLAHQRYTVKVYILKM
jgi:hypothetical protein